MSQTQYEDQYDAVLPRHPNIYGEEQPDGFRQRWAPGAFGDLTDIHHVRKFTVHEDDWRQEKDGSVLRTILKAEIIEKRMSDPGDYDHGNPTPP